VDEATIDRLRAALERAGYRYDAVVELLGGSAHAALRRNETTPGVLRTRGGGPLETLVRLWLLQTPVALDRAEAALGDLVEPLCAAGLLERSVDEVAARVDVRPAATDGGDGDGAELLVLSDLTPGLEGGSNRLSADHVLGVSAASTSLAQLTVRTPAARALDLGTGCGVQALHLARHVGRVVATDVNERALWMARINARLNGLADRVEVRAGSLFGPVADERFDIIATNPPFVISPGTDEQRVYRDSGLPGDQVVERIVRGIPDQLAPGGTGQVLANWLISRGQPWEERLGGWLDERCDAWVVQREVLDLPAYVELWLKDSGHHPSTGGEPQEYRRRYDTWLSWLEEQGAEAVGFGWINLRLPSSGSGTGTSGSGGGAHRLEEWPWEVAQPIASEVVAHFDRVAALRGLSDEDLAAAHLVRRADVQQETFGPPGAADPATIVLRQQTGLRRARQVDTVEAALVGACDGDLAVAQILAALAELLGASTGDRLGTVRELVEEGFLVP
jgi:hypothetical protein